MTPFISCLFIWIYLKHVLKKKLYSQVMTRNSSKSQLQTDVQICHFITHLMYCIFN